MKHIRFSLLILASTLINFAAFAQTSITGRVLDAETREGEVAAIAQLLQGGESITYTITDSAGVFFLKTSAKGEMTLRVENLGARP